MGATGTSASSSANIGVSSCASSAGVSIGVSAAASWAAFSAASRAAISSNSFLDLRPRFLGAGFSSTTVAAAVSACCSSCFFASAASASAKRASNEGFFSLAVLLVFVSKFSPSAPLTVYTLSLSFLVIRVRLRLETPPLAAESSAALSRMA